MKLSIFNLLLIQLFSSQIAGAGTAVSCVSKGSVQILSESIPLCFLRESRALVSVSCVSNSKCGALDLLNKAHTQKPAIRSQGQNPASIACAKAGGVVEIGVFPSRDESTFCRAADGTRIEAAALTQKK